MNSLRCPYYPRTAKGRPSRVKQMVMRPRHRFCKEDVCCPHFCLAGDTQLYIADAFRILQMAN